MIVNVSGDPTTAAYHEAPGKFEQTMNAAEQLTPDERIALMKAISASLNGPRFYTHTEVEQIVRVALQEFARRYGIKLRGGIDAA